MYEVSAEVGFSAAHFHPDYDGPCRRVHGHNYRVIITVRAEELNELGMVCDFLDITGHGTAVAEEFDHRLINDHTDFTDTQPSAENIAQYFFTRLQGQLDKNNHWLHAIEVWENDQMAARYIRSER